MKTLALAIALAASVAACDSPPDHVMHGAGLNVVCPALCLCEVDPGTCTEQCIATGGWAIKPDCRSAVANCVIDAEDDGSCRPQDPYVSGTLGECASDLAASASFCR